MLILKFICVKGWKICIDFFAHDIEILGNGKGGIRGYVKGNEIKGHEGMDCGYESSE